MDDEPQTLEELLGAVGPSDPAPQTTDLRVDLELTFEEAAEGCAKTVPLVRHDQCPHCDGLGLTRVSISQCITCESTGRVQQQQGFFLIQTTCPTCGGSGKKGERCPGCKGLGYLPRADTVDVTVPAGVADENMLCLARKGENGGCLYVVIAVKPHARFHRIDDDLHVDVALSKELAATGGRVKVPLLRGEREVDLPANTKSGDTHVLRGCGIQKVGAPPTPIAVADDAPFRAIDTSGRGNLVVTWRLAEKKSFKRWLLGR